MDNPSPVSTEAQLGRSGRFWTWLTIVVFLVMVLSVALYPLRINRDCALQVYFADLSLDGERPFIDFYDTNPIYASVLLALIPTWIARLAGTHPVPAFTLFVIALAAWSTYTVRRELLRGTDRPALPVVAWLTLSYALASFLLFHGGFGQREHFFVLLYVPLFFYRWNRWHGRKLPPVEGVVYGAVAAVGAWIKPHYFLVCLMPELYWLIRTRNARRLIAPEAISFALTVGAYVLFVATRPQEARENLFGYLLPLVLNGYGAFDAPMVTLLTNPVFLGGLVVMCVAFIAGRRSRNELETLLQPLAVAALAGAITFVIQHKGWNYHLMPLYYATTMLVALMLACPPGMLRSVGGAGVRKRISRLRVPIAVLGCAGLLVLTVKWGQDAEALVRREAPFREIIASRTEPGDRVLFVTTSVEPILPCLVQMQRKQASRYVHMWPIAAFYRNDRQRPDGSFPYRTLQTASPDERRFMRDLVQDVHCFDPSVILIRDAPQHQGCPAGFQPLDYLQESGVMDALKGGEQNYYVYAGMHGGQHIFVRSRVGSE